MNNDLDSVPSIRSVVFDMDGLMFDTERLYFDSETELLKGRGWYLRPSSAEKSWEFPACRQWRFLGRECGLPDSAEDLFVEVQQLFQAKLETDLHPMPGLFESLSRLESLGIPRAVGTSTHRELAHRMLGAFSLVARFEFVLTGDDVTHGKPHPEMYLKACERLELAPAAVMVLEDSYNVAVWRQVAGCRSVAIPHHLTSSVDFSFADLVADGLLDKRIWRLLEGRF